MDFDMFDILGITQLMDWGSKMFATNPNSQYIQQPTVPVKFQYRPQTFDDLVGQERAKDKAKLTIELINKGFPRHFLFMGNAGYGKTTISGIVAKTLGFNFNIYVGSNFTIDTMEDFLIQNQDSSFPNVLFIDEMAEMKKDVLTYMLPIIEDFCLNGLKLRPFCLIGATTDTYILSKRCQPFLDRIHSRISLEDYNADDIRKLLINYNNQIHMANVTSEDYNTIANNCRFNPRLGISLFDFFIATNGDLKRVLDMNRIIVNGLTDIDIRILKALNSTNGKAVGEESLAIIGNMTRAEYKELTEPYLIRSGLIFRSNRGRTIGEKGKLLLQELKCSIN